MSLQMERVEEVAPAAVSSRLPLLPVSVIIAARNEGHNLSRCLDSLREVGEVYVVDSQSIDDTVEIAESHSAKVVQFHYQGGWPKKRQWAMDSLPLSHDWVLLVDVTRQMALAASDRARLAS
jgi:cellulose synthase/poly-beta-1,6-N-acetylglucosamine synthase-like glycosyltransferase